MPRGVVVVPAGARGDDQRVGDMAVEDEALAAVELEAVARRFGAGRDVRRRVARAFVGGEREQALPARDLRQILRLLLGAAAADERGRGKDRGRQQRRQRQVAPDRLLHQARGDIAESRPAVRLGNENPGEPHLRHLRPQPAVEPGRIGGVAQAP